MFRLSCNRQNEGLTFHNMYYNRKEQTQLVLDEAIPSHEDITDQLDGFILYLLIDKY